MPVDRSTDAASARELSVDVYRVFAVTVVVIGHWLVSAVTFHDGQFGNDYPLDAMPWTRWLTLVFQVVPVFFLVGGYASAASWTRWREAGGRRWTEWVRNRLAAVLGPTTAYVMLVLVAVAVLDWVAAEPQRRTSDAHPIQHRHGHKHQHYVSRGRSQNRGQPIPDPFGPAAAARFAPSRPRCRAGISADQKEHRHDLKHQGQPACPWHRVQGIVIAELAVVEGHRRHEPMADHDNDHGEDPVYVGRQFAIRCRVGAAIGGHTGPFVKSLHDP